MARLLRFEAQGDREKRLICSVCWGRHKKAFDRKWLFHEYNSEPTNVENFELRRDGDAVQMRENAPGREWRPYEGQTVFCMDCLGVDKVYRVFDPRTEEEVQA